MKKMMLCLMMLFVAFFAFAAIDFNSDNSYEFKGKDNNLMLTEYGFVSYNTLSNDDSLFVEKKVLSLDFKDERRQIVFAEKKNNHQIHLLPVKDNTDIVSILLKNDQTTTVYTNKSDQRLNEFLLKSQQKLLHNTELQISYFDEANKKIVLAAKDSNQIIKEIPDVDFCLKSDTKILAFDIKGFWIFKKTNLTVYDLELKKISEYSGFKARIFNSLYSKNKPNPTLIVEDQDIITLSYLNTFWFLSRMQTLSLSINKSNSEVLYKVQNSYFSPLDTTNLITCDHSKLYLNNLKFDKKTNKFSSKIIQIDLSSPEKQRKEIVTETPITTITRLDNRLIALSSMNGVFVYELNDLEMSLKAIETFNVKTDQMLIFNKAMSDKNNRYILLDNNQTNQFNSVLVKI